MHDEQAPTLTEVTYAPPSPIYPLMPLLTGMAVTEAAWKETEDAYRAAAQMAEATSLNAIASSRAADTLTEHYRAIAARYEAGLEPFTILHDDGQGAGPQKVTMTPKNADERRAAMVVCLRSHALYQQYHGAAEHLRRQAAEATARHERAVMDCRLCRLRLEMLLSMQRGTPFALSTAGDGE